MPLDSMPCGRLTPDQLTGRSGVCCLQGEFSILVFGPPMGAPTQHGHWTHAFFGPDFVEHLRDLVLPILLHRVEGFVRRRHEGGRADHLQGVTGSGRRRRGID
jgi:hypothetical protein